MGNVSVVPQALKKRRGQIRRNEVKVEAREGKRDADQPLLALKNFQFTSRKETELISTAVRN